LFAASFIGGNVSMTSYRAVRDFFSPHGKNLSPYGKFNDIDAKYKQKSVILFFFYFIYSHEKKN
jgi:hypothetical protein